MIHAQLDEAAAVARVAECAGVSNSSRTQSNVGESSAESIVVGRTSRLLYPYHWLMLRFSTRTLFGESGVRLACLVDARTGLVATVDPFESSDQRIAASEILDSKVSEDEALRCARRYASYVLRNKRKALSVAAVEVLDRKVVHKPFVVVTCERLGSGDGEGDRGEGDRGEGTAGGEKARFEVLVDATTGGLQFLVS